MSPTRRQVLAGSLGLGALAGFGVASRVLLSPRPSDALAPVDLLARALFEGLRDTGRSDAFFPYDHPLRQYHNRGVPTGGVDTFGLRRREQALLVDLVHASLSDAGRDHLPHQQFLGLLGVAYGKVAFCGSPFDPPYQLLFTSAHLNLRIGGRSREGIAFGGPQVYGDQRGNGQLGVPGNAYRDQLLQGQRLMASLSPGQRTLARRPRAPVQTAIEVQGRERRFEGVPVAELSAASRALARDFLGLILGNYAEPDAAYAWTCIEHAGGLEAFHLADYDQDHQGGRRFDDEPSQIFRLESPAAVFHYRAVPHLHAFLNVAREGERPLSLGEPVGENPKRLEAAEARGLLERALRAETGEPHAWYPTVMVGSRLREGTIRTGDLWLLESWDSRAAIIEVDRADLTPEALADLQHPASSARGDARLRLAVPDGVAAYHESYGIARRRVVETHGSLRDALIASVRASGFTTTA